jgi:hypothetical protein
MNFLKTVLTVARENPLYVYAFCFGLIAFAMLMAALISVMM